MAGRIEDYAVIGNCETAALVGRDGSIDWLCLPRFDSAACFSALLGDPSHGRWLLAPSEKITGVTRRYADSSLVLETDFETEHGAVRVTDFMARSAGACDVLRRVTGLRGKVTMRSELCVRMDYGSIVPWVTRLEDGRVRYVAGPDRLLLQSDVPFDNKDMRSVAEFDVQKGEHFDFILGWSNSFREIPAALDFDKAFEAVQAGWSRWAARFPGAGEWSDIVLRSLITLKALTHFETGGIVAAATTSLPEQLGGSRNWDYRYCWLRDATLTLYALLESNFIEEATAWQRWLLRAVAGSPAQLQIMYGVAGERRLDEWQIPWLPGYEGAAPVRVGNAASGQIQLDVYGEVMDALYFARQKGLQADGDMWGVQCAMIGHLQEIWDQPDDGIWEVRGGRKQFTHSKVMAWVAIDRAIRAAEEFDLDGPVEAWKALRETIHAQVCAQGFDAERNSFVQYYGSKRVDASLLMIALVGFLPASDPRVAGTVAAIEEELLQDGFVLRYRTEGAVDGLKGREGAFLACSFWLADNYVLLGRIDDARKLFEKLVGLCNDVGLLAEEYDPYEKRQIGNFPQAFSHIALINTAYNLQRISGPAAERSQDAETADA
ncbi:MAG: glucoamylase [Rhodospirillales bacterium 20-64-7]|nr:MAG: glucoamylase [Rhodospirillales bacterium 20-64-7]